MPGKPAHTPPPDEHITLLDLIVVVAESWKFLLLVPLAVALIAFVIASFQPQEYRSSISLAVAPDALTRYLASDGMTAIAVANNVSPTDLQRDLSLRPIDSGNPHRGTLIAVRSRGAPPPSGVLQTLADNLNQALTDGRIELPYGRIRAELSEVRESIAFYSEAVTELTEELEGSGEDVSAAERIAVANVMSEAMKALRELEMTESRLMQTQSGLSTQMVIAAPTESRGTNRISPTLTAVLAALTVGLLVLIWVFVREGFRRSSSLPGGPEKLSRIKRAFAFRRTKA